MNILLQEKFGTQHETIPFSHITLKDYEDAIMEGMRLENEYIEKIVNSEEIPTFKNTILPQTDFILERASTAFFNLTSANTSDEMDKMAQRLSPILAEHSSKIMLDERLFQRVKYVYEHQEELNDEEKSLLEKVYTGFVRNGALLNAEAKKTMAQKEVQLSKLTTIFSQNHLKETNAYTLHIQDKNRTSGIPEMTLEAAAIAAKEKGLDGWVFTLHQPSYGPFMTYADDRELRKEIYMARNTQCCKGGECDNRDIVCQIVNLRREIAQLLGYKSYADYVLEQRMAQNKENVFKLIDDLYENYMPVAKEEIREVESFSKETEGGDFILQPWDFAYYSQKLKKKYYDIDSEMLRPYFKLENVKKGVFGLATRLYGISFRRNKEIDVYHSDVEAYDVIDEDGSFLAVLYADFFPRASKQSGAWMTSYKEQHDVTRPHVSLVMNLTKPTSEKPSLLTLDEVETFLHEFGHALHGMFSKCRFQAQSGTNVFWDFVELPSQFMENYSVEKEFLSTFAYHYVTGELIPDELLEKIQKSRNFQCGYQCIRQLSFCMLDMAYYTMENTFNENVLNFEAKIMERTKLLPNVEGTNMSVQFGHIMSGGYSAGYYSYKWAEVLDADAFALFKINGIFNKQTAEKFRKEVLSKGSTRHPMELYKAFRCQEPTVDALLERNGIKKMDKKRELDMRYLRMATIWSENSYCERRKVGALVVKDKMIISDGFNGTPSGFENICEDDNNVTKPYVLHAEANAITKIARIGNNSDGSTMYVTDSPCIECAKLIIQAGIKRVIYSREYRITDGIDLLKRAGVEVVKLEII